MDDINLPTYMILKALRIGIKILTLYIVKQHFTGLYIQEVFVLRNDPPNLNNFVTLFIMIDLALNSILFAFLQTTDVLDESTFLAVNKDLMIVTIGMLPLYFLSYLMYTNKYFLYKDDGLRAIRSLNDFTQLYVSFVQLMPYALL